ncbi:helix-turn-helix domain-containing protein [Endozoicomonas sp. OPT23]|uniref:helix-turn-helix domain-containing protein n=1 Tax=Endozoicomonas sp. OPT23 TaxID=2072845 RepID=UPI001890F937|nr:helix-turn-helix domain-containing protein [Endozoicomonas sp. OPT23]
MQPSIRQTAEQFYKILTGEIDYSPVVMQFFKSAGSVAAYKHDDSEQKKVLNAIRAIPEIQKHCQQWLTLTDQKHTDPDLLAEQFIANIVSSVQEDRLISEYRNICGQHIRTAGRWNDYRFCRPNKKVGWTLQMTVKGSGRYNCVRSVIDTEPRDILLFAPDAYLDNYRHPDCEQWQVTWLLFREDYRVNDLLDWPEVASGIYRLKAGTGDQLSALENIAADLMKADVADTTKAIRIRATMVEHFLLRCTDLIPETFSSEKDHRVIKAMAFMEENLNSSFTLEQVAAEACLSPSRFSALFRENCGTGPMQWREEKRITRACHKLANSHTMIAAIAAELGYADQVTFSRNFRKYMEMTPSQYRKRFNKRFNEQ